METKQYTQIVYSVQITRRDGTTWMPESDGGTSEFKTEKRARMLSKTYIDLGENVKILKIERKIEERTTEVC